MDIKKLITNHKWIVLLFIYFIALGIQIYNLGLNAFISAAGIGLVIAILTTILNHSRLVKKTLRKIKHFLGFGMFKWEAVSVFTIKKDAINSLKSQEEEFIKLSTAALEHNKIDIKKNVSVQTSFDKLNNLKIFLDEYVMYLDVSITDADMNDDDGNELIYLTIKTRASLRFRDNNKAINGLLLDFYYFTEKKYNPTEQKYTFKIEPENMSKDFLKSHFINEFSVDEIDSFNITSKKSKTTIEKVNEKVLTITTDRREELNSAIRNLILRLS
jgi:hypothetical protein